jgi:hypothetical protein
MRQQLFVVFVHVSLLVSKNMRKGGFTTFFTNSSSSSGERGFSPFKRAERRVGSEGVSSSLSGLSSRNLWN